MSVWDYVLLAAVAAALVMAVRAILNRRKKGCGGCGGACAGCARYSCCGAAVTRRVTPSK